MFDFHRRSKLRIIAVAASALAAGCGVAAVPVAASAAGPPASPYTQCPAIGASPSCEILLVVNPDNTVSVKNDSSVGPFDGNDDTLVGIVNDSSAAVKAVTVSGPGSGLSGFDGDGICSGAYGTWTGSSGCPYGSTGYEGPGTSFVTKQSLPDSAEVDFAGSLAPGKRAYFSLEGALATAKLTAREGGLVSRYVALGDSFSSGEGNPPFIKGTDTNPIIGSPNHCHRSSQAYGPLIQSDLKVADKDFVFRACSGAIMADFVATLAGASGQYTDGAQLDALAPAKQPSDTTGLVTLSIGGNDAGFPFVLNACVDGFLHWEGESGCVAQIKKSLALGTSLLENGGTILVDTTNNNYRFCGKVCVTIYSVLDKIPGYRYQVVTVPSLAGLYEEIHQRAPEAAIRVLLYPHLFPKDPPAQCTVATYFGATYRTDRAEMNAINNAGDSLDKIISSAVATAQGKGIDIQPVDARTDFAGHEVCSAAPWFNGLIITRGKPSPYSFHPNALGQKDFATLFEASL
jgi:lysophospholipase L1-like esterase